MLVRKAETRLTRTGGVGHARHARHPEPGLHARSGGGRRADPAGAVRRDREPDDASHVACACGPSLWLGLASDAVGRARAFVRAEARRTPGTMPPAALRLAETVADLGSMRATVHGGLRRFRPPSGRPRDARRAGLRDSHEQPQGRRRRGWHPRSSPRALAVCGVSGYRCDSPYTRRPPSARRAQRGADDQQRSRPRGQRRDAARCTRKTEVATTEGTVADRPARVPGSAAREHGLLIPTGVPGVYGRSGEFEDTVQRVDRFVGRSRRRTTGPR